MKRVICLYRVSTLGQVDHDDIPMQRKACREYAAMHPDWQIVDEISEKGVSGYKTSATARDAIIEIKKRAMARAFDVLLVFMFDRLGRRGHIPYGYRLEYLGRTNKTKRGTNLWRGTSVRALIDNPIYIGMMHIGDMRSKPFEEYRIIDDDLYERCLDTVKGRFTRLGDNMRYPEQTKSDNLLSGFIYCAHCGNRLSFYRNTTRRKLADGTERAYDRHLYRCYRRINARETCDGMNAYKADTVIDAVLHEVRQFFTRVKVKPKAELMDMVCEHNADIYQVAYKQAEEAYHDAHKRLTALEEQTVRALTGDNSIDIGIINAMIPKYRAMFERAKAAMDEAKANMENERASNQQAMRQVDSMLAWADVFDNANKETRHMILARLIDRVEVGAGYRITIKFKISYEQFMGKVA